MINWEARKRGLWRWREISRSECWRKRNTFLLRSSNWQWNQAAWSHSWWKWRKNSSSARKKSSWRDKLLSRTDIPWKCWTIRQWPSTKQIFRKFNFKNRDSMNCRLSWSKKWELWRWEPKNWAINATTMKTFPQKKLTPIGLITASQRPHSSKIRNFMAAIQWVTSTRPNRDFTT